MEYRKLGETEMMVSVIGFGAIKLPQVSVDQAVEAINRAIELGVNFIDTARNYKDSERKVGAAVKGKRDKVYIATKTASRDYEGAMRDIETSLRELDVDRVDLLQLHSVSDEDVYARVMAKGGALEAVRKAQEQGMVDHIGITIHRAHSVMKKAILSGEFETIMLAYSPLDQEGVEKEIIPMAHEHGMGVIIMKPLSGGTLTSPNASSKTKPERDPIVFGSLWYITSNPNVSVVIPGMRSVREVEENVQVGEMTRPMTEEEIKELRYEIGKLGIEFRYGQVCLRCGYCQPCPQGILIPEVFRAYDMYKGYPDNLKHMGIDLYKSLPVSPEECVECGECEEKCPAGLPIREMLKMVVESFKNLI